MQLSLEIEFDTLKPLEKRRGSIQPCCYCKQKKECYEFLPLIYEIQIDIYNGAMYGVCESCYNKKNEDGYLDEVLRDFRRLNEVRAQKSVFQIKRIRRKLAIIDRDNEHKEAILFSKSTLTRKVFVEKSHKF